MKRVTKELSYGGGCINDVVVHLATSEMGLGNVGKFFVRVSILQVCGISWQRRYSDK